jgi:hypothetical protein
MCGLFTSIIEAHDLVTASIIVVFGEVLYMIVFKMFNVEELKESFIEILAEQEIEEEGVSRSVSLLNFKSRQSKISDAQRERLKKAYLHPFEVYAQKEIALKLNKDLTNDTSRHF